MSDSSEKIPYLGEGFRAKWGDQPEIEKACQDGVNLVERTLAEHGVSSADVLPEEVKRQLKAELETLNIIVTPGGVDE